MVWTGNKKAFCVLEFDKTESFVTVQRGFGPCTTQNHLRTKQFVSGTWNSSRVAACAVPNEQASRGHRPCIMCGKNLITGLTSAPSQRVNILSTYKVGQELGVSLALLTCSPSAWPSWLLYRRGWKLWITLYIQWMFSCLIKILNTVCHWNVMCWNVMCTVSIMIPFRIGQMLQVVFVVRNVLYI
jgi:hypothetical protein